MPNSVADRMTQQNLEHVLDYLSDQLEAAETKEEVYAVMDLARELFKPDGLQTAVQGLPHLRAELDHSAMDDARTGHSAPKAAHQPVDAKLECTVNLAVPSILSNTFQDLSERMTSLQHEDPETFANATSALTWLATGDLVQQN